MAHRVAFKTKRGRRVAFVTGRVSAAKVRAARKARGRALARKYGFIVRKGVLMRKRPNGSAVRVRIVRRRRSSRSRR